ncbi:hypothetical protein F0919_03580 [Taibaiella lutea]|uniref:Uncharacterized protein n=1 Tax=Taibaiella lutea TaxID=2608001 RepID=A0A5M6CP58_9BACT|nr:hypothetical protein [Taibaiella lutea]KAA5536763.1 hypothetical protein F0919_03580 [Taibaiella lutea]
MFSFARMAPHQVDKANVVLILISLIIALFIPFELFLFSYAILGPLHYLTEISWLHHKKYFLAIPEKGQKLLFPLLIILLVMLVTVGKTRALHGTNTGMSITNITIFVFFLSLILIFIKRNSLRLGAIAIIAIVSIVMNMERETLICTDYNTGQKVSFVTGGQIDEIKDLLGQHCADVNKDNNFSQDVDFTLDYSYSFWVLLFSTYIPTLIHVYIFTLLFMLYGALKSNSVYGKIGVVTLLLAALFLLFVPVIIPYHISGYALKTYDSIFASVNKSFMKDFNYSSIANDIYTSKKGLMLARFIAFAYTYHYLNWFSKTSIIQWHKMPKTNLAVIVILWITSIAVYLIDFKLGFTALLFLSFLHVYLEFPLNLHSMKGIWEHLFAKKITLKPKAAK